MPVKTFGLTHVALAVRNVERSSKFYRAVLGAVEGYRQDTFAQLQTPGARGGIAHSGFRLQRPKDMGAALRAVKKAGGRVTKHGEFVPGEPYLFATDPDGYEFEIWYELPTPLDPPR